MTTRPLIKESLAILNIAGINPGNFSTASKIKFILIQLLLFVLSVEILVSCVYNWRGLETMEDITGALTMFMVACKVTLMVWNRQLFLAVFDYMDKFHPLHKCERSLRSHINSISRMFLKYTKILMMVVLVVACFLYSKTFFSPGKVLPFRTYHPGNIEYLPAFLLVYFLELLTTLSSLPCVMGFDMLFVALILNISWEFKVIVHEIATMLMVEDNLKGLYGLIDRHNLVLCCIKDMSKIYSGYLLITFAQNVVLICVGLLCIIASGFPPGLKVILQYGLLILFYIAQSFFYCFVGSHLTHESEKVSIAVFQTNWWTRTQPKLRLACCHIIQRANRTEELVGGGMFGLNLKTFTQILNTALSFFTLIKAVYSKED